MIPSSLLPVSWFKNKGAVTGIVGLGFGLSALVFSPLQTYIINPNNAPAVKEENGTLSYFVDEEVLEKIPLCLLYMAAIYAALFTIGILLATEKPKTVAMVGKPNLKQALA